LEASWNQLDITGKVNDEWYSAAGNRADYADKVPVNRHYPLARKLVKETILQAKMRVRSILHPSPVMVKSKC